jgi:protein-tyrosine phosphatase
MADTTPQNPQDHTRRHVGLDGGFNFRDLGGYATEDGRRVRWGKIYRSGMMNHLSDIAHARMAQLGIRYICDLRTTREQREAPTQWKAAGVKDYWSRDYEHSDADLRRMMSGKGFTADESYAMMKSNYRTLAYEQAEAYRQLFHRISEGNVPAIFNCSAGKDRTGVAAALLLSLLGVPRETILDDYELTNETIARDLQTLRARGRLLVEWSEHEALKPMIRADRDYLLQMFDAVEEKNGSVEKFLHDELGVDSRRRDAIRTEMLE